MTPTQAEAAAAVSILTQRAQPAPTRHEIEKGFGLSRRAAEIAILEGHRRGVVKSIAGIHAMPVVGDRCREYR